VSEDWKKVWQQMIGAIGQDFSSEDEREGADVVEKGAIRKFLEPLEFDCPLHYDRNIAIEHGYSDIIAPYSSINTWSIPALWEPGDKIFDSAEKNAQPTKSPVTALKTDLAPDTTGFIVTDVEMDYIKPVTIGDHVRKVGNVLLSCEPKETKIGRGAFMVWESKFLNQHDELLAVTRLQTYNYEPHPQR
jgi:hypothetical protein